MCKHWEEWICNRTHSITKNYTFTFHYIRKAIYEEVAEWVSDSWKKVKTKLSWFREFNISTNELFLELKLEESDDEQSNDNEHNDIANPYIL